MFREPLTREETIKAIKFKKPSAIPLVFHKWEGSGLLQKYGEKLKKTEAKYPDDVLVAFFASETNRR